MSVKNFSIDGRELKIHYADLLGVGDIIDEVVIRDCYRLKQLRDSGVVLKRVIDAGAHMGTASAMIKHFWPKSEVLAIEPQGEYTQWIKSNGADRIFNVAIQYAKGRSFYVSPYSSGSLVYDPTVTFSEDIPRNYTKRDVPFKTLETITDEAGWSVGPIDLLKADIEGAEVDLLCNMTHALRQRIRMCLGEFHHLSGYRFIEQIIKLRYPHWKAECWCDPNATIGLFAAFPKV